MNLIKIKSFLNRLYVSFGEMLLSRKWALTWGVFMLLSVMGMSDLPDSPLMEGPTAVRWLVISLISLFKATLITYALYLSRKRRIIYISFAALAAIYAFLCFVNFMVYGLYGFGITTKLMTIIAQTNHREFTEFMQVAESDILRALGHPAFWAGVVAAGVFLWSLPWLMHNRYARLLLLAANAAGVVCLCFCAVNFFAGKTTLSVTLRTAVNVYRCIDDRKTMETLEKSRKAFPHPDKVTTKGNVANIILVIGESASKSHHSIYGYPLPTTPYLNSIRRELFIFSDAVGSGTATAHNIECILSFKSDNDTTLAWHDTPWLIDLFRHAGYKTFWLSNQEKTGMWSNTSAVMISDADVIKYVGAENNSDHTLDRYDSDLLPPFDMAMRDSAARKLICLHLLGSHFVYSKRYPPEYDIIKSNQVKALAANKWMDDGKASTVAAYDNSIRYTDSILEHLIKSAACKKEPTLLLYFSDHGEVVYDGRDFRGRDLTSVRVPFIIYANNTYRNENPEIINRIRKAERLRFSTSDVIHLLMGAAGISYPYYNQSKDPVSGCFIPRTRYVDDKAWKYDRP